MIYELGPRMRALVVGASGGLGSAFVTLLAANARFSQVTAWSRSAAVVVDDKIFPQRVDLCAKRPLKWQPRWAWDRFCYSSFSIAARLPVRTRRLCPRQSSPSQSGAEDVLLDALDDRGSLWMLGHAEESLSGGAGRCRKDPPSLQHQCGGIAT